MNAHLRHRRCLSEAELYDFSEAMLAAGVELDYVSSRNTSLRILEVDREGRRIIVLRSKWSLRGRRKIIRQTKVSITWNAIARILSCLSPGVPVNLDAALNGSCNNRTCIETILLRHPHFYLVRANGLGSERGRKHMICDPSLPHEAGVVSERVMDVPSAVQSLPSPNLPTRSELSSASDKALSKLKTHHRVQAKLCRIASDVGLAYRLARDDQGITVGRARLSAGPKAVRDLAATSPFDRNPKARSCADLHDLMLFSQDGRLMSIVEVEKSTKMMTALTRMQSTMEMLYGKTPRQYRPHVDLYICADDARFDEFSEKASLPQFGTMGVRFLPFSEVDELHSKCVAGRGGAYREEVLSHYSRPPLPRNKC